MVRSFLGTGAETIPVPLGAGINLTRTDPHLPFSYTSQVEEDKIMLVDELCMKIVIFVRKDVSNMVCHSVIMVKTTLLNGYGICSTGHSTPKRSDTIIYDRRVKLGATGSTPKPIIVLNRW